MNLNKTNNKLPTRRDMLCLALVVAPVALLPSQLFAKPINKNGDISAAEIDIKRSVIIMGVRGPMMVQISMPSNEVGFLG